MSDLRGFTALAERMPPERVLGTVNEYFRAMIDVCLAHGGSVKPILGDALFVIFGAPLPMEDQAAAAVASAIEMQNAMRQVNERNRRAGHPELQMGIGLNTAVVVVGNIGSERRAKFGVIGSGVNATGRIESYATGGQVLASQSVVDEVGEDWWHRAETGERLRALWREGTRPTSEEIATRLGFEPLDTAPLLHELGT